MKAIHLHISCPEEDSQENDHGLYVWVKLGDWVTVVGRRYFMVYPFVPIEF